MNEKSILFVAHAEGCRLFRCLGDIIHGHSSVPWSDPRAINVTPPQVRSQSRWQAYAFDIHKLQPTLFDANNCCRHAIQLTLDVIIMRFSMDLQQEYACPSPMPMRHLLAAHPFEKSRQRWSESAQFPPSWCQSEGRSPKKEGIIRRVMADFNNDAMKHEVDPLIS